MDEVQRSSLRGGGVMVHGVEALAVVVPIAEEHRLFHREDLSFKIQFRVLPEKRALHAVQFENSAFDPKKGRNYSQNISEGGLGFCGDLRLLKEQPFKEGDFLEIEIHGREVVHCLGTVAWVELDPDAEIFRAGVTFFAVKSQDLERLGMRQL